MTSDYYCNQKFWWLNVDLEKHQQYSCCSALPSQIDFDWLKNNSGQLFNTPILIEEREAMLSNILVNSCQDNCFVPESQGLASRRLLEQGNLRTHTNTTSAPTMLNIVMGATCNMTCVYCCKQYSSAWLRDVRQNGPYLNHNRYRVFPIDLAKKHNQTRETTEYKILESEISMMSPDIVHISGGEPFLYNNLVDLVFSIKSGEIRINTGLGVDATRFKNLLDKISEVRNLKIFISVETENELYEFVRYGNTYQNFKKNLQTIIDSGIQYQYNAVVSNLTILGLIDFYNSNADKSWYFSLCNDPDYLGVNVLDNTTKKEVIQKLKNSQLPIKDTVIQNLETLCTPEQHRNFSKYLIEFAKRRNLSLEVLPPTLIQWIQNVV